MRTTSSTTRLALIRPILIAVVTASILMPGTYAAGAGMAIALPSNDLSGPAAVSVLGERLDDVASAHQMEADELVAAFATDPSLHVDETGCLFYVEEARSASAFGAAEQSAVAAALPLETTFELHSRPGATKVIYLDFNGHLLSGTAWNATLLPSAYACPAFDTDGSPSTFNDTERRLIQEVWQRVSEDFLPFDVDVTTQQPPESAMARTSTADQQYGTRVLISPIGSFDPGSGGRAYVGVFNRVNYEYYKPALVYSDTQHTAKVIAETASHEAGHNLYLVHDGTSVEEYYRGDGQGWGPIMGAPFGSPLTQWNDGGYAGANSSQDDLAVIAWAGPGYRADDHGDAHSSATTLTVGAAVTASGMIGSMPDVDVLWFRADGSDTARLTASPASVGANLTLQMELADSSGAVLKSATSNSLLATPVSALIETGVLPAGVYFVRIAGVGNGSVRSAESSDYGSLGAWSLTVEQSAPVILEPVYRFYNARLGTHFYTASETEKNRVIAALAHIYTFEGEAYSLNPANNTVPLHRFYNPATGTHFYTASEAEKDRVRTTLSSVYQYEGPAYAVSLDSGGGVKQTVWRFYNRRTGTHFYTAEVGEMNRVKSTLGHIYTYEGPAYYLGR